MRWGVGSKIATGFGLALAVFILVGTVSYRATSRLIEATDFRKQTYDHLSELQKTVSLLQDMQIGQRGYILTGDDRYLAFYDAAASALEPQLEEIRQSMKASHQDLAPVLRFEQLVRAYVAYTRHSIDTRRTKGFEEAVRLVQSGQGQAQMDNMRLLIRQMMDEGQRVLKVRTGAAERDAENAKRTIFFGMFAALLLAAIAAILITRDIAAPLRQLTMAAEKITTGDLNANVPAEERGDEVGVLARAFARMTLWLRGMAAAAERIAAGDLRQPIEPQSPDDVLGHAFVRMSQKLRGQIADMFEGTNVLGAAASQIVASTTQLAASATESAAAVTETTTTVEEVRQTAQVASEKARLVSETAQKAAQVSQSGRKSAADLADGMTGIRQQMEAIAASMVRLSEQSHAIGQIIATVEELATQSNLLAVNAAIEAAKAGEQGKGFSVVAQEVKSLAEQSRQATTQVRTILGDIQKATASAVMATEEGGKAVQAGTSQAEAASNSINSLALTVTEAAQAATQISASSQQQLVGVAQVAGAMESIRQASTQNVESARQLEVASRNLNELGQRLKQTVEQYRV